MSRLFHGLLAALVLANFAGSAWAEKPVSGTIVVAPLATLGNESSNKEIRKAQALVSQGVASVAQVTIVDHKQMLDGIKKARRPELRSCDGNVQCLSQLGTLLGSGYVVYGEVGGLGSAQVIYLKLVDVAGVTEIRNTVLELGGTGDAALLAKAAATRLLAPDRFRGHLAIASNVKGASIFVDGRLVARSPSIPVALTVGAHALRVTHPEFRDFVRFVDIAFGAETQVDVSLRPFAAVSGDMGRMGNPKPAPQQVRVVGQKPTPCYKRWYTVAGRAAVLLVTSAVLVGLSADGIDFDRERTIPDSN